MTWFDQHGHRVADLLATRSDDKAIPIYALPDLARLCVELDEPPPPPTNHDPSASAGGPYTITTGQSVAFAGSPR